MSLKNGEAGSTRRLGNDPLSDHPTLCHCPARRAFTLIELLVVIAIIALLIGILLPTLAAARDSAKTIKDTAAIRSLMQAYSMYADDHDGLVIPAHLRPDQAAEGIVDEFGNEIGPPVSQRWGYRLAPYFDYGWAGTTHVGKRADLLEDKMVILRDGGGVADWSYQVSVFPSFGINRRYVGGDYRRTDWLAKEDHVRRISAAFDPSGLLTFASSRFYVGTTRVDGYIEVDAPPLDATFEEDQQTLGPTLSFGNVHPRYSGSAAVGWLDGHVGLVAEEDLTDRRIWSNTARRLGDADWEP